MLHAYVRRFDVMGTVEKFLGTKRRLNLAHLGRTETAFPDRAQGFCAMGHCRTPGTTQLHMWLCKLAVAVASGTWTPSLPGSSAVDA